ncbi:M28 family metallopeptidase [Lentiprolixibacter aurantiacus]|uniref:M28 family metallopeptidase n=1 Tax=Lentiprolixibacter aurantiacus TaxID=2993939 RepID=A0AAE3SNL7_9FLAO|nr:M28 family metallopeptidase [Lentiprolixibacter aurantiacus]MCX2719774.1 M28 family metallopeptidase [Lentiprolixibacter aurantiacus]
MKKLLWLSLVLIWACNSTQKSAGTEASAEDTPVSVDPVDYASTITEEDLKEHLYIYASDEFEGRETGKEGQKKAVEYLKATYEELNIPAAQENGDYFQKVPLEMSKLPVGSINIEGKEFEIGNEFLAFTAGEGSFDEIVYVGYGIEDENYSDYKDVEVKGKLLVMKFGEPQNADGTYVLSGNEEASVWSNMSEAIGKRTEVASAKGAKGILYFDPANYARYKGYYQYMKRNNSGRMAIKESAENPVLVIMDQEMGDALMPNMDGDSKAQQVAKSVEVKLQSVNEDVDSENVVAIIRGSQYPDEYVVISSHLDHVGVNDKGEIHNGADDDGSGSVAMLEIAEAFKIAASKGVRPKRSIVFLHVTGEEKGLLGSQYYTDFDPIFPLTQTVANLNIDMIGRIDPKREGDRNYVYLIGSDKLSSELHQLSEEVNTKYAGIELDYKYNDENDPNRFYYRSDHYNFAKNNIPIIFYFNGTHDDYHRPGDTPDKINYDLLRNRTRLVFHTAWEVANREQRVAVDKMAK